MECSWDEEHQVAEQIQPCLSVVMPCFNEEATLALVAKQVLESPYTAELIIVDDGSTDDSLEVARALEPTNGYERSARAPTRARALRSGAASPRRRRRS